MFNISKEIIIVLVIVLIIFGPTQLPKLAKMMGKSMKGLRDGMDGAVEESEGKPEDEAAPKEVAAATEEKPAVESKESKPAAPADEIARLKAENARLAEAAKKAGSADVE
jgi:sec-independent protein translocase protein TatA